MIVDGLHVVRVLLRRTVNNQTLNPAAVTATPTISWITSPGGNYHDLAPVTAARDEDDDTALALLLVATDHPDVPEHFAWRITFTSSDRPARIVAVPHTGPAVTIDPDTGQRSIRLDALADFTGTTSPGSPPDATRGYIDQSLANHNTNPDAHPHLARADRVTALEALVDQGVGTGLADIARTGDAADLTGVLDDARIPTTIVRDTQLDAGIADAVAALRDGAPAAWDTLREIVDRLDTDDDTTTAILAAIADRALTTDLDGHTGRQDNPHQVTAAQLGLQGLDQYAGTSPAALPVSDATQAALDQKLDAADAAVTDPRDWRLYDNSVDPVGGQVPTYDPAIGLFRPATPEPGSGGGGSGGGGGVDAEAAQDAAAALLTGDGTNHRGIDFTYRDTDGKLDALVRYGTTTGTALQGDDPSRTNARVPLAHRSTHHLGGADPITPAGIGAHPRLTAVTVTGAHTATVGTLVLADAATTGFAVTLPAADGIVAVKKIDNTANTVTITAATGYTIGVDQASTLVLRLQGQTLTLQLAGTNWTVTSGHIGLSQLEGRFVPTTQRGPVGGVIDHGTLSSGSFTPDAAASSSHYAVATGNITLNAPTQGVTGQPLHVRVLASGGTRTLTLSGAMFRAATITPTVTIAAEKTGYLVLHRDPDGWTVLAYTART